MSELYDKYNKNAPKKVVGGGGKVPQFKRSMSITKKSLKAPKDLESKPKSKGRKLSESQLNANAPLKKRATVQDGDGDVDEEELLEYEVSDLENYVNELRKELGRPPLTDAERAERKRRALEETGQESN